MVGLQLICLLYPTTYLDPSVSYPLSVLALSLIHIYQFSGFRVQQPFFVPMVVFRRTNQVLLQN